MQNACGRDHELFFFPKPVLLGEKKSNKPKVVIVISSPGDQ